MTIERLGAETPDITKQNIARLAELFPECVTEGPTGTASDRGEPVIDWDLLRQTLSDHLIEGPQERYRLDWPGKRQALLTANAQIDKTLRPMREDSVDFDTTRNLFIEGDNLDALKLLQETYLGKVKLIYIDPPYNTGKDFIYRDDFSRTRADYETASGLRDEGGGRLIANPETKGRFHSDWLSMMYPRLRLARNLLRDDGLIAVSIDDGEVSNLRKVLDEVFGEDRFIAQVIWKKRNTPPNDRRVGTQHDYLLIYSKLEEDGIHLRPRSTEQIARYKNPDGHAKGPWVAGDLTANVKGGRYVESLHFPITNPRSGREFFPPNKGNWRFNSEKITKLILNDEIYFGLSDDTFPKLKRFLADVKEGITWTTLWDFAPMNTQGSAEMQSLFGDPTIFENPKPVGLLTLLMQMSVSNDDLVLDFFAGSGSTAHAVAVHNQHTGAAVQMISVQIPDEIETESPAYAQGFRNIAQLSRERVRRAGKNALLERPELKQKLDVGFRALTIDSGNFRDTRVTTADATQTALAGMISHIKDDRTDEDLLFGALLNWGVDVTLPLRKGELSGRTVWFVDAPTHGEAGSAVVACFARPQNGKSGIDTDLADAIAALKPLRVLFRDDGFATDAVKENVASRFKQLAPDTTLRVL